MILFVDDNVGILFLTRKVITEAFVEVVNYITKFTKQLLFNSEL